MLPDWAGNCRGQDESPAAASGEQGLILPAAGKAQVIADRSRPQVEKFPPAPTPTPTGFEFTGFYFITHPDKMCERLSSYSFLFFFFLILNFLSFFCFYESCIHHEAGVRQTSPFPQMWFFCSTTISQYIKVRVIFLIGVTHLALLVRGKQLEQKGSFWSEQMQTLKRNLLQG